MTFFLLDIKSTVRFSEFIKYETNVMVRIFSRRFTTRQSLVLQILFETVIIFSGSIFDLRLGCILRRYHCSGFWNYTHDSMAFKQRICYVIMPLMLLYFENYNGFEATMIPQNVQFGEQEKKIFFNLENKGTSVFTNVQRP